MELYENLTALRKKRGMSQEQLANELGVSRQAISKWESGSSMPEISKLIELSEFYGVSVDFLLKGSDRKDTNMNGELRDLKLRERKEAIFMRAIQSFLACRL